MIITDISPYKGKTLCMTVTGRGSAKIYINTDIAAEHHLKKGMTITADELRGAIADNERRRCMEWALYLLDYRLRSRKELFDKLCTKYKKPVADAVCSRLEDEGVLDDRAYAEYLVNDMSKNRHYGVYRIKQELYRRGIDADISAEVLTGTDTDEELLDLIRRRYADKLDSPDKVKSALARRGYTYAQIKQAIEAFRNADE